MAATTPSGTYDVLTNFASSCSVSIGSVNSVKCSIVATKVFISASARNLYHIIMISMHSEADFASNQETDWLPRFFDYEFCKGFLMLHQLLREVE